MADRTCTLSVPLVGSSAAASCERLATLELRETLTSGRTVTLHVCARCAAIFVDKEPRYEVRYPGETDAAYLSRRTQERAHLAELLAAVAARRA